MCGVRLSIRVYSLVDSSTLLRRCGDETVNTDGLGWRGGLVVGRRTCDLVVAGSRPGRDAAAQQP